MKPFNRVYCISLTRCRERRAHMVAEFARAGVEGWQFIDAVDKNSTAATELFDSDFVLKYPPCFRCGKAACDCSNKALLPVQIANWLSHMDAWRRVQDGPAGLSLVCEDDIRFQAHLGACLELIGNSRQIRGHVQAREPLLIRLGWSAWVPAEAEAEGVSPSLTTEIRMANACYAINEAMAALLLGSLRKIDTTSDIYLHDRLAADVAHYTVMPPAALELSWTTGELLSEIRPKAKHVEYLRGQLCALAPGSQEYQATRERMERELARIRHFEELDAHPERQGEPADN